LVPQGKRSRICGYLAGFFGVSTGPMSLAQAQMLAGDTQPDDLASARRTLETEKNGLIALEQGFAGQFAAAFAGAVAAIAGIAGRVIVTGVGKSGHIGAKLAATLASTGTPAFFVHAAEANHGDLGMIAKDDAVLAMSWSGETSELKAILAYSRRFRIPLIALTANADSALGRAADHCLVLPKVQEACPHGLAPTTSTLLQMVVGDALAIALLERRGFSAGDFHMFHPGGSLGANLTHVDEIMHGGDRLPVVDEATPMPEAIAVISAKGFGCVAVTGADGTLAGVITDGDLRRNIGRNLIELTAGEVMTRSPKAVPTDTLASTAIAILNEKSITALIVTEADKPVGIIHMHDLLRIGVA
jgi:arabinose-5-phosphate isomerase